MFNHIVTLNNVIAIIALIEEKIFENAEEKTNGAIFVHTHTQLAHFFAVILFEEMLMTDDQGIE